MNPSDRHTRELAQLIWESEGRPEGQSQRHWQMACRLAAAEAKTNEVFILPHSARKATSHEPI